MDPAQPVTVAYRGNFSKSFCTEVHVAASLESLGHTVIRLQENEVGWLDLERQVLGSGAQMLLWTKTWMLDPEGGHIVLGRLRDEGIPSASFHLDRYIGLDREAQIAQGDPFWRTDVVFTADGGHQAEFEAYGVNHVWLPPAVHEAECRRVPRLRRGYPPIVFVGSHPYPHPEWRPYRDELIGFLKARYGGAFGLWPRGRAIRGQELTDLYGNAQVVIGDSCLSPDPDGKPCTMYQSDRAPETIGRGGFLIHPRVEGITDGGCYTEGEHLACYDLGNWDELGETIDKYLAAPDERQTIAAAGKAHVLAHHTYAHRMQSVLAEVDARVGIPEARQPAPVAVSAPQTPTAPLVVRHAPTRQQGRFSVAQGDTDATAVREVWTDDTYHLTRPMVAGKTVLDIGANVGAFSVLAAKLGAREVHAFEPHPDTFAVLEKNLAENGVGNRVRPMNRAITGAATPTVTLSGDGGGATITGEGGIEVPAVSLAEVIGEHAPVGFIKTDIEGAELWAFASVTAHLLHENVERMVLESHGPGMPHLAHLDDDGHHLDRWKALIALLADCGRVQIMGHPTVGGIVEWQRY